MKSSSTKKLRNVLLPVHVVTAIKVPVPIHFPLLYPLICDILRRTKGDPKIGNEMWYPCEAEWDSKSQNPNLLAVVYM